MYDKSDRESGKAFNAAQRAKPAGLRPSRSRRSSARRGIRGAAALTRCGGGRSAAAVAGLVFRVAAAKNRRATPGKTPLESAAINEKANPGCKVSVLGYSPLAASRARRPSTKAKRLYASFCSSETAITNYKMRAGCVNCRSGKSSSLAHNTR